MISQVLASLIMLYFFSAALASVANAQAATYPKEIRGYKVEQVAAEKPSSEKRALLSFGSPELARVTPLGITFEIPLIVSPVRQKGHVEFLVFEDIVINDTKVQIEDYQHGFELPGKEHLKLHDPLNIYIYLPSAVLAAVDEWSNSKEKWQVTGRIYVFGKFKKSIFSAKRCVPVELDLTISNPLRLK